MQGPLITVPGVGFNPRPFQVLDLDPRIVADRIDHLRHLLLLDPGVQFRANAVEVGRRQCAARFARRMTCQPNCVLTGALLQRRQPVSQSRPKTREPWLLVQPAEVASSRLARADRTLGGGVAKSAPLSESAMTSVRRLHCQAGCAGP